MLPDATNKPNNDQHSKPGNTQNKSASNVRADLVFRRRVKVVLYLYVWQDDNLMFFIVESVWWRGKRCELMSSSL